MQGGFPLVVYIILKILELCDFSRGRFSYGDYKFKIVDAIITNFHLPKSTLIMLISAFGGKEFIFEAYKKAIEEKYRFYSFGDSMFIY